jgi:mono/diheme cytochrome c family protein
MADSIAKNVMERHVRVISTLALGAMLFVHSAIAADVDNGKRLAEARCAACHFGTSGERGQVADSPPFDSVARKYAANPQLLVFAILNPHPRMNLTITRREAEDLAAFINTLAN